MNTIGERLLFLRKNAKLTMPDIEKLTNIPKSNISKYEKDKVKPSADALVLLSKVFNITTDWILTGESTNNENLNNITKHKENLVDLNNFYEMFLKLAPKYQERILERIETYLEHDFDLLAKEDNKDKYIIKNNTSNIKYIPNLGLTAAGEPLPLPDDYTTSDLIPMPESTKADFALTVRGNSMEPDILNGSTIYIKQKPSVENGSIAIVALDDTVTCKKFYKINDNIELRSINPNYDPIIITPNNNINFRIIGEVVNS